MLDRVENDDLLSAGLALMRQQGRPLTRQAAKGRAMVYATHQGETVRVRTCNDHVLVVLAESPGPDAKLNVEGTDFVLIVMPKIPRSPGPVVAYLVPSAVVAEAARKTHKEWLANNPNTKGNNRTWNLWFDESGPSKANGFSKTWEQYRLHGHADTGKSASAPSSTNSPETQKLGQIISIARREIAAAAGVPESAVRITVDLA